jgi:hypothetical protein
MALSTPDLPKATASLQLPGKGAPTATTSWVSVSMTTWWLVEYR